MKSYWVLSRGGKTALEFRDIPVPQVRPDEILLRVRATALNRGEFNARYQAEGEAKPGGHEAAGEVVAVGSDVKGIRPGERIIGRAKRGYAEYSLMSASEAIPVPERLGWEQATGVPLVFLVTYDMLYPYGKLKSGDWLLVTGKWGRVRIST